MMITWEQFIASLTTVAECQEWIKSLRDGSYDWDLPRYERAYKMKLLRQRLREVQRGSNVGGVDSIT